MIFFLWHQKNPEQGFRWIKDGKESGKKGERLGSDSRQAVPPPLRDEETFIFHGSSPRVAPNDG